MKRQLRLICVSPGVLFTLLVACSDAASVVSKDNVPAPQNVAAIQGDRQISLFWEKVDIAEKYAIYWSSQGQQGKLLSVDNQIVHTQLVNNQKYIYEITAINSAGSESNRSKAIELSPIPVPDIPNNVILEEGGEFIKVTWEYDDSLKYDLYWTTDSTDSIDQAKFIPDEKSPYFHTGLNPDLTYYYFIKSSNSAGSSEAFGPISASPIPIDNPPQAPQNISIRPMYLALELSWSIVPNAKYHRLYFSNSSNIEQQIIDGFPTQQIIDNVTSPSIHSNLDPTLAYYYVVTSVNAIGESSLSTEHFAIPTDVPDLSITELLPNNYVVTKATIGSLAYIDRTYTIDQIEPILDGLTYIQTANDDKFITSSSIFLTFSVNRRAKIYVAFSQAVNPDIPQWLKAWAVTLSENQQLEIVIGGTTMFLYEIEVTQTSPIILGGNFNPDTDNPATSMYVVFIKPL